MLSNPGANFGSFGFDVNLASGDITNGWMRRDDPAAALATGYTFNLSNGTGGMDFGYGFALLNMTGPVSTGGSTDPAGTGYLAGVQGSPTNFLTTVGDGNPFNVVYTVISSLGLDSGDGLGVLNGVLPPPLPIGPGLTGTVSGTLGGIIGSSAGVGTFSFDVNFASGSLQNGSMSGSNAYYSFNATGMAGSADPKGGFNLFDFAGTSTYRVGGAGPALPANAHLGGTTGTFNLLGTPNAASVPVNYGVTDAPGTTIIATGFGIGTMQR